MKILQENSTHVAREEGDKINVYEKGLDIDDLHFPEVLVTQLDKDHKDDLFSLFEEYDESNRWGLHMINEVLN